MPKIILTSRYLRDAPPEQLENYVRYVSIREGVEKVEGIRANLPSTARQKELIRQIVRDIPSTKEMLEYDLPEDESGQTVQEMGMNL